MKILISGATGQLGSECARVLSGAHQVVPLNSRQLDITDQRMVGQVLSQAAPDAVLNCSAFTGVDACETERERAWNINVNGPQHLAVQCRKQGALLVHISTDYVFDGKKPAPLPYVENDIPAPLSWYGKTKLESERAVRAGNENHIILRTAWLYGISGSNFLKTILRRALKNPSEEMPVVNDRFGSPTWAYRLALQIAGLVTGAHRGTFHATAEGHCTWYELACLFLELMELPHRIIPCGAAQYPAAAVRPVNAILENLRLKEGNINLMCPWQDDIASFVRLFRKALLQQAAPVK